MSPPITLHTGLDYTTSIVRFSIKSKPNPYPTTALIEHTRYQSTKNERLYVHQKCSQIIVLWYSPGSLTRRKIWDTAGYQRVSHAFEGMCI